MSILPPPVPLLGTVRRLADGVTDGVFSYPAKLNLNLARAKIGVVELGAVSIDVERHPGVIGHENAARDHRGRPRGSRPG
jgi:hypothetical protein